MDFNTVGLSMSDEVKANMDERGVREEDVREVLSYAESKEKKLYFEGEEHFLARKRMNTFSAYVEYILNTDSVEIVDVYSHVIKLSEDEE